MWLTTGLKGPQPADAATTEVEKALPTSLWQPAFRPPVSGKGHRVPEHRALLASDRAGSDLHLLWLRDRA